VGIAGLDVEDSSGMVSLQIQEIVEFRNSKAMASS